MGDPNDSGRRVAFDLTGGRMAGVAFGDGARPADILFLHDSGLNALTYRDLLAPLGARFHVVAVDLRGHGRTNLRHGLLGAPWDRLVKDIVELLLEHFPTAVTLAGHGMGSVLAMLVAGRRADLVRGLCMIDPAVDGARTAKPALRARYATREDALAALKEAEHFHAWPGDVQADFVEDACLPVRDGVFRFQSHALSRAAPAGRVWRALARAPGPITLVRADRRSAFADAAARRVAALRPDVRFAVAEGGGASLPFENPARVRVAIEGTALAARGER